MDDPVLTPVTPASNSTKAEQLAALFQWPDYVVFFLMLLVSASIGAFFGFFTKKKATTTKDFLMAGKSMGPIPIAMSLIASFISAITLLGTPSETYQFGFIYYLIGIAYIVVMPAAGYLYLPVFWNLNITSAYEYLEIRFHRYVRRLGSVLFVLQMTLYMAIVVYAPSLALSLVTGLNLYLSVCLICFVCMFYTTVGGMKAVLWTDTVQVTIMLFTIFFIAIYGTIDTGGFAYVWDKAFESERAEFVNWDPNPTTRHTFWTLVIGGYFTWITIYGCNQAQVQRYLCARNIGIARTALYLNCFGLVTLMLTVSFMGLVMYARYEDCDPIRSGIVTAGDQLFPLFVMETMGHFRGLPGLFVAGIFSGALGTVSAGINSLAAITLEDFVKGGCYPSITNKQATLLTKCLSFFFGLVTLALVFVAQLLGNILSAALGIFGIVGGPLLGMFSLGMFFPWANSAGCFTGASVSLAFMLWVGIGHHTAKNLGYIDLPSKNTSVAGCTFDFNDTMASKAPAIDDGSYLAMDIFELSYLWYSATGCFIVIVVGLIVSFITGAQDVRKVNPKTITPLVLRFKNYIPGLSELGAEFEKRQLDDDPNSAGSVLLTQK